ncbi:MAG: phosphate-starvation-inducible protein PsiF [Betaproteobacteria bacterium]|nr:phosphate-starvation-inducible protein PsiF [Betaproteobacteria bacterium]
MHKFVVTALFAAFCAAPAFAENAQQNKMKECNAQAKEQKLSGDDRKKFMSECLSAAKEDAKKKLTAQQEKMKSCNAEAKTKDLKGADRKKFMSDCLSAN